MKLGRSVSRRPARAPDNLDSIVRLDLARNPYGPCPAAMEATALRWDSPIESLSAVFRRRLSETYRVPIESIHLLKSADRGLRDISEGYSGPIVRFPPSTAATLIAKIRPVCETVSITRGPGRDGIIGPDFAADLPERAIAFIDSPADPLGSILALTDAVRLSRACRYLVIDERFAEFSDFSLLPLAIELENVVVLRSFEAWAGIPNQSCAWAVASPRLASALVLEQAVLERKAIAEAMATLNSRASVSATLKLIREERSRLYRLLRKLSFLDPLPSWAPFLAARVDLVPRQILVDGLFARGIRIHAPPQPGLERFVRIGIGTRIAMDRLRTALLELAPQLVG